MARKIRVAIAGVGNSASSLVQGIEYYRQQKKTIGLARTKIGPYSVPDIHIVAAFDIDKRKVGKDLSEAIFQEPNNTRKFVQLPRHELLPTVPGSLSIGKRRFHSRVMT